MRRIRSRRRALVASCPFLIFAAVASAAARQGPSAPAAGPQPESPPAFGLPRGEVVDPVICDTDPSKSYALYLPSNYTPERRWPVLFVLDARGRGRHVAERFQAAAERFGWVVASSNDSASDAGWEEVRAPAAALFGDVPERVAMDPARFYLAGFSGTARAATAIAANADGGIAGVIAAGAGIAEGLDPGALPFALFATAGTEDFNFLEVDALVETLAGTPVPHRIEIFDGAHAWPPEELATAALGWFELRAMAAGRRPLDLDLAAELASGWLAEGAARERGGDPVGALRLYRSVAADLRALELASPDRPAAPDTATPAGLRAAAESAAARLAASDELRRAEAERRRIAAWEAERRREVERVIVALGRPEALPPPGSRVRGESMIRDLLATAESDEASTAERHAARRVLALIGADTGFYLPRDLLARGAYRRAETVLELAVLVRPNDARSWYNLACARARLGREKKALDALERAVESGFADAGHLAADPDLTSLRGSDRFQELATRIAGGR